MSDEQEIGSLEGALDLARMAEEPLASELEDWIEESELFGPSLKHPLVFQVPLGIPGLANRALEQKKVMLARALEEQDWHAYVWIHERPYRFTALQALIYDHPLPEEDRLALIRDVWIDSENVWQHFDEWIEIFETTDGDGLMLDDEKARLAALPDPVPVYRGATLEVNEEGLSWTLDPTRARWFARRFNHKGSGVIIHATVSPGDIVALFEGRSEDEVIILPEAESLSITRYEEL